MDDGGETVFARGEPPSKSWAPPVPSGLYEEGSWEKSLAETCRTAFVVPPERGGALLYYGMGPDGEMDEKTLQGTCPVLEGEKWCAHALLAHALLAHALLQLLACSPCRRESPRDLGRAAAVRSASMWVWNGCRWGGDCD